MTTVKSEFKVSYYLWKSRKDKDGLMPVYIRSKQNSDKQISYNTGVKLLKEQWNKSRNEPKNKPAKLIELEGKLKDTYRYLRQQEHDPDLTMILAHLNDVRKPSNNSIVSWCEDYDKSTRSEGRKKSMRTLKSNIEGFNARLTFDKLTSPTLKAFFEYLTKQGVANNSQAKRLHTLVNLADYADIKCLHLIEYKLPYKTGDALKERLDWSEVKAVMNTETKTALEAIAKDVFLLACFSGLRISDLLTLNRGTLHDYHFEKVQIKTNTPVLVTLHKYNEDLFHKYTTDGIGYTRQRLSAALKKVLERSGMTKEVVLRRQVGDKFKETVKQKYEEIAFHSGRRFYARLLNDLGLGGEIARDELGHGFENVTDLYAGSPNHNYRVTRVSAAIEGLEETYKKQAAAMKVAKRKKVA